MRWINSLITTGNILWFLCVIGLIIGITMIFFGRNNKNKSFGIGILAITLLTLLGRWLWQNTGWYGIGGLIALALLIAFTFTRGGTTKKVTSKTKPGAPAVTTSASKSTSTFKWGKLFKQIASLALLAGALFYGVQFWKEPTLVTSFLKGIFQRKELRLNKWFGVNAGEKYSVIIGSNTLGVWPIIKGDDTVTVTLRNSQGTESFRVWNGSHYGRIGAHRLTPSLDPTTGVFTYIFDKNVEVKLSTMPPK